jgi:hypothetical protein
VFELFVFFTEVLILVVLFMVTLAVLFDVFLVLMDVDLKFVDFLFTAVF